MFELLMLLKLTVEHDKIGWGVDVLDPERSLRQNQRSG